MLAAICSVSERPVDFVRQTPSSRHARDVRGASLACGWPTATHGCTHGAANIEQNAAPLRAASLPITPAGAASGRIWRATDISAMAGSLRGTSSERWRCRNAGSSYATLALARRTSAGYARAREAW